jgi:CRP-like cAMP-binding protein
MAPRDDPQTNAILARLPASELDHLAPHLEVVEVDLRQTVYAAGGPITHVYFPLDSVFSVVAAADEGVVIEVATMGREAMVGLPLFLGAATSPHAAFCQIPGSAVRLRAPHLKEALRRDGHLHAALNRLTQATMVQIAQNVVCNATHSAEQRAARWLLTTQDRVGRSTFPLTQQFLSQMLALRRPTVSEIASRLQQQGLIRYSRGELTILDRRRLLRAGCPCYAIVKAEFDALIGER